MAELKLCYTCNHRYDQHLNDCPRCSAIKEDTRSWITPRMAIALFAALMTGFFAIAALGLLAAKLMFAEVR